MLPTWGVRLGVWSCATVVGWAAAFWPNVGQLRDTDGRPCPEVLFVAELPDFLLFVRTQGLSYVFVQPLPGPDRYRRHLVLRRVDVEWLGTTGFFQWQAEEPLELVRTFYRPEGTVTGLRAFRRLLLRGVFPEVDVQLSWSGDRFKYDLIAHRAEALADVRFRYVGTEQLRCEADGSLLVGTAVGQVRELPPRVFQHQRVLAGHYVLSGDTLSFAVPEAMPGLGVVFDPGVVWATYYGGSQVEEFLSVATDRQSNVYAAGWSISPDFPVRDALQSALATTVASDAVVVKFSAAGQPLWATYYGGDSIEVAYGIACDAGGNVAIVGTTSSPNFPTQNAFQSSLMGLSDAFVLRLTASGQRLWATYYGGSGTEIAYGVAYTPTGDLVVGGSTSSTDFPVANALQSTHGGGTLDGFLLRFTAAGQRLWATYYGGSGEEDLRAVAVDSTGAIVAVGQTSSQNFPVQNALQPTFAGGFSDGFVVKLTGSGQRLWATYYGGNRQDAINAVAILRPNRIVVGGSSLSDTIPLLNAVQPRRSAALDAFVTCLDSAGGLLWGTFYGGSAMEEVRGLTVLSNRSVLACGYTYSSNFPRWLSLQSYAGSGDAFLVMFHYAGTLQWSTPLGGSGYDIFHSVAADTGIGFYACGSTTSTNYPIRDAAQNQLLGSSDAVLVRFERESIRCRVLRQPLCAGDTVTVEFTVTGGFFADNAFTAVLSDSNGDFATSTLLGELRGQTSGRILARIPDTIPAGRRYRIRVLASSPVTVGEPSDTVLILHPPRPSRITVTPDTVLCPGDSIVLEVAAQEFVTYTWYRNNVPIAGTDAPRLVVRQAGRYTVEVRNPCGSIRANEVIITPGTPPARPAITASGPTRLCRGDSVVLSTTPMPEYSYHWYRNGEPYGADTSAIIVREAGAYTLAVRNRCGIAWSRDTVRVILDEPLQTPVITVVGSNRFCEGDSVQLQTQPQATAHEYRWYRNGRLVLRHPLAWTYTVRSPGWYSVEITNTCGSVRSDSIAIEVLPRPLPPRITVQGGVILCSGDSTVLATSEQPNARYYWYRNGQLVDTTAPRYVVRREGTYTVEILTPCGRARSLDSVTVTVFDTLPHPQLHVDGSPTLCDGDSLRLWLDPIGGAQYTWYRDGTPLAARGPELIVRSAGTYWVQLSSPCGERISDSITVTLLSRPEPPQVHADGPTVLCEGDSVRLSLVPQADVHYAWYRNDTLLARDRESITVSLPGTYWVSASNRCGESRSAGITITVLPRPPKPVITQEGDTLVSSSPTGNQWLDSAGTPIPGATEQRFVPSQSGYYRVRVTRDGCSAESEPYWYTRTQPLESVWLSLRGGSAQPGDVVELPLLLRIPPRGLAATGISLQLRYWARLLEPLPPTPLGTIQEGWRILPLRFSTTGLAPGEVVLERLRFHVLLGDRDRTPLFLEQLSWEGDAPPTTVSVDTFIVAICREGGDRLFVPTESAAFVEVVPNPASAVAVLRYGTPERGTLRLSVCNSYGQEVANLGERFVTPGVYEEPLYLTGLSAGTYAVLLQLPSQRLYVLFQLVP